MNETPNAVLDQAAFQRVWQRVMPQDRPDCPFTLEESDPIPTPQPLVRAALAPAQAAAPQPTPCLGEASAGELPALSALMDTAARARQAYLALSRRMGGRGLPSAWAAQKGRQLRRLGAAYFLIAGREYTPRPGAGELPRTNALALREGFRGEQRSAAALMEAQQATADPCLRQLYLELTAQDREIADQVRERLERR